MNYKVFSGNTEHEVKHCKIYPKPYNENAFMEYVMLTVTEKTELIIKSETEIKSALIRPLSAGITPDIRNGEISVMIDHPVKLSVEVNGSSENNLMIFADNQEMPLPEAVNCITLKKGEKHTGTLHIDEDDTIVYIEEGAVLYGNIIAENCRNLTICGRGRICMEDYTYEMRKDFARSVDIRGCTNVTICDIIIDDSNDWSMRITGCDDVEITNVKIFGCRGNSDGIDICGSRNVTVSDIFTRVWDDSFVVKALDTGNSENIVFKNSVLWNDFARPIEVGVELRADRIRNIRFENIDIIHSTTGYPLMGIHHGDRAEVSDIVFDNIRIEDTPGAQLFDIRIADSVWSRDTRMGNIHDIVFSNIAYTGLDGDNVMLSNSRIEGFSEKHNVKNVRFHNISIKGKAVLSEKELGLDVYEYAEGISVSSDEKLPEASVISCEMKIKKAFEADKSGQYAGRIAVVLENDNEESKSGTAVFAVSPKNVDEEREFSYNLSAGERAEYEFNVNLPPGKYVFYIKNNKNEIENKFLYAELDMLLHNGKDIDDCPEYHFINYYNMKCAAAGVAVQDSRLIIKNRSGRMMNFILYTAMPAERNDGEVIFSAEETDFGEVCAYVAKGNIIAAAPQIRCPAEITYVFKNEPKVKEIVKTDFTLNDDEIIKIPFAELGIEKDADNFLMEIAAKPEETKGLRYPYTLFHSTMPEKTAHMYGTVKIAGKDD